ncbi:MAG: N-diacetylbacillosaminyl-diphospho-undecaprenol alpha,3-N-acetylgalactosaminyltransferase [Bacteroidota bacterium]|jgi:glycosyltransferase involved in cell wall biosynthesis
MKKKLVRITTVPISLDKLLSGQLRYMNQFYEVIGVSSEPEALKKLGEKENIATYAIGLTRKITPITDIIAIIQLTRFLRKTNPFIVHTHTPKAGLVGMIAARFAGVPHRLHTVAGLPLVEATGVKRIILNWVEKITYAFATKVYPNSKGLLDFIQQEKFCPPSKLKVLANGSSNGIDTHFFDRSQVDYKLLEKLTPTLGLTSDDFVFIYVGRLVKDKGIHEMVNAFVRLAKEYKQVKLLLVGEPEPELDPLQDSTLKTIQEHNNIITTGFQYDVRPYFALAHCLIFPSYREGFPNVVLQAGALAVPAIVSNINGCNEIIQHEVNGLIIPVKDENAIFESMKLLVSNTDVLETMKQVSRSMIINRYEQDVIWQALLEEYQQLEYV